MAPARYPRPRAPSLLLALRMAGSEIDADQANRQPHTYIEA